MPTWRAMRAEPSSNPVICLSQLDLASSSRLGGSFEMSESLMASMTFASDSRITWILSIPK